jgi:3-phosphoshikimate 1-carboxyvinyltransferase
VSALVVQPQRQPLLGSVPLPADALQSAAALVIAALATGTSTIRLRDPLPRALSLVRALEQVGVVITAEGDALHVQGRGISGWRSPVDELDLGSDRFAAALLTGALAGQGRPATVAVRGSARELARLFKHLSVRGAALRALPAFLGEVQRVAIEATVTPGLAACDSQLEPPDPAIKGALLISGLHAPDGTAVAEAVITPDHVERLLSTLGLPIVSAGGLVTLAPFAPPLSVPAFELAVPGDTGLGGLVLAAAALVPESRVMTRSIGLNPTRTAILDVMRHMGVPISTTPHGERLGEPFGDVSVFAQRLAGVGLEGELRLAADRELPVIYALAACAEGRTELTDLEPLEPQRIDRLLAVLGAFGVSYQRTRGAIVIEGAGSSALRARVIDCEAEPEAALLATLLALRAQGECRVSSADGIAQCYPRFVGTLRALGARIGVEA